MKETGSNRYIVGLDVARIVCAAIVLLYHLAYADWRGASPFAPESGLGQTALRLISAGWVGVPVFFIISGFVIAYSARDVAAITFLRHRIIRLVPGMTICATTTALIVLATHSMNWSQTLDAWFHSVTFRLIYPYIDPSHWTLPIEVLFYCLVFLALLFNQRRRLALWIAMLGCSSLIYCALLALSKSGRWHQYAESGLLDITNFVNSSDLGLVNYGIYFALGAALYSLLIERQWRLGVVLAPLFLGASYFQMEDRNRQLGEIGIHNGSFLTGYALVLLAFLLIASAVQFNEAIMRHLGSKSKQVIRRLGLMTYSLYLIHQAIGTQCIMATHVYLGDKLAVVCAIILAILLALVISLRLEPPFSRWLRGLMEREA